VPYSKRKKEKRGGDSQPFYEGGGSSRREPPCNPHRGRRGEISSEGREGKSAFQGTPYFTTIKGNFRMKEEHQHEVLFQRRKRGGPFVSCLGKGVLHAQKKEFRG